MDIVELSPGVAVVTGGARGIGGAIVDALAGAGASLAVWDLDEEAAKAKAKAASEHHGITAVGIGVDVSSPASVQAGADLTEQALGPIEILVNNAGVDVIKPFLESNEDEWQRIVSVNLLGTVRCCRTIVPQMVSRGRGVVVNIGSDAGRVGSSGEAVYSASKGGVIAFTKSLAREVARYGVRANCVCPGPTNTALLGQVAEASQKLYDGLARAIPLRRIAEPSDIGPAVAFLASDGAAFITGQTLSVSGGLTMA